MKELNMAWELLKMGEDYGDVSISLDQRAEEERARKDAIERQNAQARKRLMDKKKEKVEFPNFMTDSPERLRELAPNANLVDSNAPPVPQTNPNPLRLSMDKLKELQRQG